jgi:enoyl-CoA hydratase/carnithine racemase
MDDMVLCEVADGLCTLTLNRPAKLNALNLAAFRLLDRHLGRIEQSPDSIGCVLLRGAGRSFCAGHDLDDIAGGSEGAPAQRFETGAIERLASLPVPVVAAVQGHCITGGLELALAADLIVAAESACFADTHGKWDLVPVWGLSQRLPRRIGQAKAMEMMFTSRNYSGRDAEAMGLANLCVPDDQLECAIGRLCADILANAWRANRAVKRMIAETDGMTMRAGIAYELHHGAGRGPEMAERLARMRRR